MEPLQRAKVIRQPVKQFIADCIKHGYTREQAKRAYNRTDDECWRNDHYVVLINRGPLTLEDDGFLLPKGMVWLSIRRQDRQPIMDWRDAQEIKNQLVGPDCEAVQLFPAEERLHDSANQYHLVALTTPGRCFGFGFANRNVSEWSIGRSQQRPFNK